MPLFYKITVLLSLSLFLGCNSISPIKENIPLNGLIVWADDGSDMALVKNLLAGQQQIISRSISGTQQQAITYPQRRDYQHLYYMKSAGYLVAESKTPRNWLRFERINLNGDEITIIETPIPNASLCQDYPETPNAYISPQVIPSPNGQILAYIYSQECAIITVDFLNAKTLTTLDSQIINTRYAVKPTWHSGGYLILAIADDNSAWKLKPEQKPQVIAYPKCTQPETRSSAINKAGQLIQYIDKTLVQTTGDKDKAFGCQ